MPEGYHNTIPYSTPYVTLLVLVFVIQLTSVTHVELICLVD